MRYKLMVLILASVVSFSQTTNTVAKAKIEIEQDGRDIKVTARAENATEFVQSFSYKLSIIKKGAFGNQSNTAQEGLFSIEPSESKNLSVAQVNLKEGDEVIALLLFYDEKKQVIGKDRVVLNDRKKSQAVVLAVDGFEIRGFVSDETKTKIGKDFFEGFYHLYNEEKISASKMVVISEELSFARNTKITITIENEVVYEFMARPDDEFMNDMAASSIYATSLYFKNLEKQEKYFIQY